MPGKLPVASWTMSPDFTFSEQSMHLPRLKTDGVCVPEELGRAGRKGGQETRRRTEDKEEHVVFESQVWVK